MTSEVYTWIDAGGTSSTLGVGWGSTLGAVTGRWMPDVEHFEDSIPLAPGGRHRSARHKIHDFTVPINVIAASASALRTALRSLMYKLDPTRGPGILRLTTPVGDSREIECYYVSGLQLAEQSTHGYRYQPCYVTFRAYDPYWRDTTDTTATFTLSTGAYFFPIFPMRLTSSELSVSATITNGGDVPTWPVWTINGPGSDIIVQNMTTGKILQFVATSLGLAETLTIDTNVGVKSVLFGDGVTNLFSDLTPTSSLWPLAVGANVIELQMTGALAGTSSMELAYRRRFLGP